MIEQSFGPFGQQLANTENLRKEGDSEFMFELKEVVYNSERVLTTAQIAEAYETHPDIVTRNFNRNRDRYIEGKHFICLKGDDLRDFRATGQIDLSPNINTFYLWTRRGAFLHAKSLNTDRAWQMYERLVDFYFTVKDVVSAQLSPELQMLQGLLNQMVQKELADKERDRQIAIAQESAAKAVQTTEQIKEEIISPFDNWRDDVNAKVREIAIKANIPFQTLFTEMYGELEKKAGCDLSARQRNKQDRMNNGGSRKSDIDRDTTKIAVIEDDKRLKQIFDDIVRRYAVKYVA